MVVVVSALVEEAGASLLSRGDILCTQGSSLVGPRYPLLRHQWKARCLGGVKRVQDLGHLKRSNRWNENDP